MKITNLNFSFGNDLFFDQLSIDFVSDKIHAIVGRNGMGKSTLFQILQGTITKGQASGTITIGESCYDLAHLSDRQALHQRVVYVEQHYNSLLVEGFTAHELLSFTTITKYPLIRFCDQSLFEPLARELNLPLHLPVEQLSGGQRQLVALLLQLRFSMRVLLLDEPTAALDSEHSQQLIALIRHLIAKYKVTVLMISHDYDFVHKHTDFCYQLHVKEGRRELVESGLYKIA